jgi:hypothetical protein
MRERKIELEPLGSSSLRMRLDREDARLWTAGLSELHGGDFADQKDWKDDYCFHHFTVLRDSHKLLTTAKIYGGGTGPKVKGFQLGSGPATILLLWLRSPMDLTNIW